jgi:hypothetical protein
MVQIYNYRSYYRKESAALSAYELNAKIYTSRQFSVISPMFPAQSFLRQFKLNL